MYSNRPFYSAEKFLTLLDFYGLLCQYFLPEQVVMKNRNTVRTKLVSAEHVVSSPISHLHQSVQFLFLVCTIFFLSSSILKDPWIGNQKI